MVPASPTAAKTGTMPQAPAGGVSQAEQPQTLQSQDLVASLPAPVFRLLVIFAQPISSLRTALEVLCWKNGRRVQSWMVLGGWWALCLGSTHAFRWLLPVIVFSPLLPLTRLKLGKGNFKRVDGKTPNQSVTNQTVLVTLNDLHSIHALLPPSPIPSFSSMYDRFRQLGAWRLTRGLTVIWLTWIVLGHLVGYRSLLAILGSVILLLPSPTLAHLVDTLSKSLAVRRALALAFLFTFGSPPEQSYNVTLLDFSPSTWIKSKWAASRRPSLAFAFRPTMDKHRDVPSSAIADDDDHDEHAEQSENPIYFCFEVHENQRWWMGLDWTSALLPQERPSWCDSHLLPVSPPPSFTLPPSSSIILPAPTLTDPGAKVKRTATWRWLDDDWSIIRAGQGPGTSTTAPMSPSPMLAADSSDSATGHPPRSQSMSFGTSPPQGDEQASGVRAQSIAEQAFTKGLERLKARTATPQGKPPSPRSSVELVRPRTGSQASEDLEATQQQPMVIGAGGAAGGQIAMETIREKDDATDADGWVYGDNKWENVGPKGGLGRFTRRRRWHRRAVCTETVQKLPSETVPSAPSRPLKSDATIATTPIISVPTTDAELETPKGQSERVMEIPSGSGSTRDDVLRQRLKKAMGSMGA